MADIFISYSSEDRTRVEPLAKALKGQGWEVFWDRTIPTGQNWRQVLVQELASAKCVVVVWSINSIEADFVLEEASKGKNRQILVPVKLDSVELPLGFSEIHSADLISWKPTQSSTEFKKLISDLSEILGPPTLEEREAEQKSAEEEFRPEQDTDEEALTETRLYQQILAKVRKYSSALIFSAVAGVLLIIGGWLYYNYQQKIERFQDQVNLLESEFVEHSVAEAEQKQLKELSKQREDLGKQVEGISKLAALVGLKSKLTKLQNHFGKVQIQEETLFKIYEFDEQVEALKVSVANIDNKEQLKELSVERDNLSNQVEGISEQATQVALGSQLAELQNNLKKVKIQQETLFKIYEFEEQVEVFENEVARVNNQEQLKELSNQRDSLRDQVEGISEQATQVDLGSQLADLRDRLKQFDTQLTSTERELIAAECSDRELAELNNIFFLERRDHPWHVNWFPEGAVCKYTSTGIYRPMEVRISRSSVWIGFDIRLQTAQRQCNNNTPDVESPPGNYQGAYSADLEIVTNNGDRKLRIRNDEYAGRGPTHGLENIIKGIFSQRNNTTLTALQAYPQCR